MHLQAHQKQVVLQDPVQHGHQRVLVTVALQLRVGAAAAHDQLAEPVQQRRVDLAREHQ
ncbi:hypothetical protein OJ998_21270 [Solirubrobacter taibaiensis]|nr:hypothetical protein [Solirubrobacter taibaiensis]